MGAGAKYIPPAGIQGLIGGPGRELVRSGSESIRGNTEKDRESHNLGSSPVVTDGFNSYRIEHTTEHKPDYLDLPDLPDLGSNVPLGLICGRPGLICLI